MNNLRQSKGSHAPSAKGEGSTYFIPADDVPDGIQTGEKYAIILEGTVNQEEQGLSIHIDNLRAEKLNSRTDPLQDKIESGLNISINTGK